MKLQKTFKSVEGEESYQNYVETIRLFKNFKLWMDSGMPSEGRWASIIRELLVDASCADADHRYNCCDNGGITVLITVTIAVTMAE